MLCCLYSFWTSVRCCWIYHSQRVDFLTRPAWSVSTCPAWLGTNWCTWRAASLGPTRRWARPSSSVTSCCRTSQLTSPRWNSSSVWEMPTVSHSLWSVAILWTGPTKHRTGPRRTAADPKNIRERLSLVSRAYRSCRHLFTEGYGSIFWIYTLPLIVYCTGPPNHWKRPHRTADI